jgi:hypothetical protein
MTLNYDSYISPRVQFLAEQISWEELNTSPTFRGHFARRAIWLVNLNPASFLSVRFVLDSGFSGNIIYVPINERFQADAY